MLLCINAKAQILRLPGDEIYNPEIAVAIMGSDMDFKLSGEAASFDWRSGLHSLKAPILVLNGRADLVITPRQAEEMAAAALGSKLAILDHSGHFCFSEQTAETMKMIREFLQNR